MSVRVTFPRLRPIAISRSTQASAAAPAPEVTSFASSIRLPCNIRPLRTAAATMIAVEYRDLHSPAQLGLDAEAFGGLDVFEVDRPKGRFEGGHHIAKSVRVRRVDLDVEHVDAGKFLEQDGLALHHRFAGKRPDIAEAEDRGAVGDDGDEIAARGVVERGARVGL